MGYIFGFGIRSAVLILAMGILSTASFANNIQPLPALVYQAVQAEKTAASVTVNITGLRNQKGDVLICLSSNVKKFPDCRKDINARKMKISAATQNSVIFKNVKPGVYALALVHDKNSNGKMDIALFLPKEGFGMSNNPKVRMGKPKFKNSQFIVAKEDIVHNIKMRYIL